MEYERGAIINSSYLVQDALREVLISFGFEVVLTAPSMTAALERARGQDFAPDFYVWISPNGKDLTQELELVREYRLTQLSAKFILLTDISQRTATEVWQTSVRNSGSGVSLVLSQDIPISVLKYTLALVLMEQDSLSACDQDLTTVPTAQDLQDPPLQDPASHLAHRSEPLILHSSGDEPPTVLVSKTGKLPSISDRERQILSCLVSGLSNKTIGRNLDIAEGTVKVHVKSVLRKIKARNRTQAAVWALNNRINDREQESYPLGTDPQVVSGAAVMELM